MNCKCVMSSNLIKYVLMKSMAKSTEYRKTSVIVGVHLYRLLYDNHCVCEGNAIQWLFLHMSLYLWWLKLSIYTYVVCSYSWNQPQLKHYSCVTHMQSKIPTNLLCTNNCLCNIHIRIWNPANGCAQTAISNSYSGLLARTLLIYIL